MCGIAMSTAAVCVVLPWLLQLYVWYCHVYCSCMCGIAMSTAAMCGIAMPTAAMCGIAMVTAAVCVVMSCLLQLYV